jgi:hypothetical protein
MGRAVAELQPFPLFPLDDYFGGMHHQPVKPLEKSAGPRHPLRIRLPLSA